MTVMPGMTERVRLGVYGQGLITAAALVSSSFLLIQSGAGINVAVATSFPPALLLGAIGLASRFLCRAMPLRSAGVARLLAAHAGSAAAASAIWTAALNVFLGFASPPRIVLNLRSAFAVGVLLYVMIVTVQYLVLELNASRDAEAAALRYRVLAREAELRAFKAQVDPHFLFNSLNAVAALCGSRPQEAREMAQRLADFFRQMLRVGRMEKITLAEEVDLVSRYLAIEKVRFGPRLDSRIQVDEAAAGCLVPPLLLQPLVENAVRHGIASVVDGGVVEITAAADGRTLRISIDNPADAERVQTHGEGIGLQNARGRLNAVSDGRAVLRARESDGRFRVEIEMPQ